MTNERVNFEKWCAASGEFLDWSRYGDGYAKPRTDLAWKAWQAARRAAEPSVKCSGCGAPWVGSMIGNVPNVAVCASCGTTWRHVNRQPEPPAERVEPCTEWRDDGFHCLGTVRNGKCDVCGAVNRQVPHE